MTKKFFLLCVALIVAIHGAAAAKDKGLPEAERIQIAVEVIDGSRHKDFNTATLLEYYLDSRLVDKNLVNVVNAKPWDEMSAKAEGIAAENVGALLVFDAVEIPPPGDVPADFDAQHYRDIGANYVVRCEILALGLTKVDDPTLATITSLVGGGLSFSAANSDSRDKNIRRIAAGISLIGGAIDMKRTALNTVVVMQFVDVNAGKVLWQQNFVGRGFKHKSSGKEFDDIWTRALHESVEDSAKRISKRVNKYVDRVIIKGKSDDGFLPKDFSFNGLSATKFF